MDVNNAQTNTLHNFQERHPVISVPVTVIQQPFLAIFQTVKIGFFLGYQVTALATAITGLCLGALYGGGVVLDNFFSSDVDHKLNFKPIYDYAITCANAFHEYCQIPKLLSGAVGAGAAALLALPVFISPYFWGAFACITPLAIIDATVNGQPRQTRKVFDGIWKCSDPYSYFNTPTEDYVKLEGTEKRRSFTHSPDKEGKANKSAPFKPEITALKQPDTAEPSHFPEEPAKLYSPPETHSTQQNVINITEKPGLQNGMVLKPHPQESPQLQESPQPQKLPLHNSVEPGCIPLRIQLPLHQPASDVNRFCTLTQFDSPKDAVVLIAETGHEEIFSYHELARMARKHARRAKKTGRKDKPLLNPNTRIPFEWSQVFRVPSATIRQWVAERKRSIN